MSTAAGETHSVCSDGCLSDEAQGGRIQFCQGIPFPDYRCVLCITVLVFGHDGLVPEATLGSNAILRQKLGFRQKWDLMSFRLKNHNPWTPISTEGRTKHDHPTTGLVG